MSIKSLVFSRVPINLPSDKLAVQTRQDLEVVYKQLIALIDELETRLANAENRISTLENEP